jgi:hypothetical protein
MFIIAVFSVLARALDQYGKKARSTSGRFQHEFPTCDLEQILTEVESGYIDN